MQSGSRCMEPGATQREIEGKKMDLGRNGRCLYISLSLSIYIIDSYIERRSGVREPGEDEEGVSLFLYSP